MAVTLGKRKRHPETFPDDEGSEDSDTDVRARFQQAFEAKFRPLAKPEPSIQALSHNEDDIETGLSRNGAEVEWDGFSEDEAAVQVVQYGTKNSASEATDDVAKTQMKSFMGSKPPKVRHGLPPDKMTAKADEDEESEATNLKHDLALQRLLKESHLLDPSSFSGSSITTTGKDRVKALDLRLRDLGAKSSLTAQRMPMAHRQGIKAKASTREMARRKEALENGIILEKVKVTSKAEKRRERSIATPSVGKFRGGTLRLNKRDVKSIQGTPEKMKGRKRR